MLYHHHQEKVEDRLPPVGIISEADTEASLEDTLRLLPFPLPPHPEEPLCHEITEYVFPKAALSKQNEWR